MIYTEGCRIGHSAAQAARAESTPFARKTNNPAVPTLLASDAKEAMRQDATTKVGFEFVKHEGGQFATSFFQFRQERRPVLLYRPVEQSRLGTVAFVHPRVRERMGVTACCWLRGKHQQEFSATVRYLLLTSRGIYGRFSPVSAHRSPFFLPLPAMIAVGFAGGPADAELYLRRRWPFLKNHPLFWELAPLSPKVGGQELRSFNSNLISGG